MYDEPRLFSSFCLNPSQVTQEIHAVASTSERVLRVSVGDETPSFQGTALNSPHVSMTLRMFSSEGYPLADSGGGSLSYYLTQCCLWNREGKGLVQAPDLFAALVRSWRGYDGLLGGSFPYPSLQSAMDSLVPASQLSQCNLWWSGGRGGIHSTGLHWDASHNLLCVLHGRKRVLLFPPSDGPLLGASPIWAATPNHARHDVWGHFCGARGDSLVTLNPIVPAECAHTHIDVTLEPGDALYIREGWWHTVASEPHSLAVNFWFSGRPPEKKDILPSEALYFELTHCLAEGKRMLRARRATLREVASQAATTQNCVKTWGDPQSLCAYLAYQIAHKNVEACSQALLFGQKVGGAMLVVSALFSLSPELSLDILSSLPAATLDTLQDDWEEEEARCGLDAAFQMLWLKVWPDDTESRVNAMLCSSREESLKACIM